MVASSDEDPLLSPAIVVDSNSERVHMFHVKREREGSKLMHSELNSSWEATRFEEHTCEGLPDGYYIWHIAITLGHGEKHGDFVQGAFRLQGLFLLRSDAASKKYRLFIATKIGEKRWKLKEEVQPSNVIERIQLCPYKACFVPNTNSILYSYIDKQNRYRMTLIEIN